MKRTNRICASRHDEKKAIWRYIRNESSFVPLLSLFLVVVCLVSPKGDFPLNDDWVYGKMVKNLVEQHRYVRHPYAAAHVAAQVLWAGLFAAPAGFSFTALRVSTLVLAFLGVWATAASARVCGGSRRTALVCGAIVLCNPIFLNLAYTFMTDVPYTALVALSGFFLLRALRRVSAWDVFWGITFAVASFFIRQFGLVTSAAFVLTGVAMRVLRGRSITRKEIVAFAVPWLVAGALTIATIATRESAYQWSATTLDAPVRFMMLARRYVFVATTYMGLFLLPLFFGWIGQSARERNHWSWARRACFAAFTLLNVGHLVLWPGNKRMPVWGNVLRDLGTGPLTLQDVYGKDPAWAPVKIGPWWWLITALAVISAGVLVTDFLFRVLAPMLGRGAPAKRNEPRVVMESQHLFLLVWGVMLLLIPCNPFLPRSYDRYILPALIPFCLLFAGGIRLQNHPGVTAALAVSLAVLYAFSVAGVQDYMAWNRARWAAIDELVTVQGVHPFQIDGGFEFNGMYTSDEFMARHHTNDFLYKGDYRWWVLDNTYAISFLPREGYTELKRVPYFSYLGMEQRHLLILKRGPAENESGDADSHGAAAE